MATSTDATASAIVRFAKEDSAVKAKAFIEILNSIDCANAQIQFLYSRQGWLGRLKDSLTGAAARRQGLIDENLLSGLENLWKIAQSMQLNNLNMTRVAAQLARDIKLIQDNSVIANAKMLALNDALHKFRESMQCRLRYLEERISRVECLQRACLELEAYASRLKLGTYDDFTLPGQLCLVAANLYYGSFQDALSRYPDSKDNLIDIAVGTLAPIMAGKTNIVSDSPQPWRVWQTRHPDPIEENILGYLADRDHVSNPVTAKILNPDLENSRIPKFISPRALTSRLLEEKLKAGKFHL